MTAVSEARMIGVVGRLVSLVGGVGMAGGIGAWLTVRAQLVAEKIVVPPSAARCAGRQVAGPWGAYAEAEFIRQTTLGATGGRAYGELEEGDPAAPLAKDAALLRASLFTSVLAFGLAAAGVAAGAVLALVGRALVTTGRGLASTGH